MTRQISPERKLVYYFGVLLVIVGALSFGSVFVTAALTFGDFSHFDENARSSMLRAFGGMALMVVGAIVSSIGARGAAGSGVVLDPEKAREDLEPYSRMVGGMLKDGLDEAGIHPGTATPPAVVIIRCRECGTLNEENSKYCQECGRQL